MASGMVSSFLAFRSDSSALSMSSDTDSITLFMAKVNSPMPIDMHRYLYTFLCYISIGRYWYMTAVILTREERGKMIADKPNQIQRLGERFYKVTSQSSERMYDVIKARMNKTIGWVCSCPDHTYRQVKCKHIWAVEFSSALREKVKQSVVIEPLSSNVCPYCASNL